MLHLDPAHPPLWRTPDCLQFGADAVAVLEHPDRWQERMVRELERGLPESALDPVAIALGGTAARAQRLLQELAPALEHARPARPPAVAVRALGPGVVSHAHAVVRGLRDAGLELVDEPGSRGAAVLVAAHAVPPPSVLPLMSADIVHVPIVLHGGGATIGPVVRPGVTACLLCLDARRCDDDPAWPALAGQLLALDPPPLVPGLGVEAGLLAARLLSAGSGPGEIAWSVTVDAHALQRRWRAHRPYEDCGCRSPAGSATPTETCDRPATMRGSASALPV